MRGRCPSVHEHHASGPRDDPHELERRGHELVAQGHTLLAKAAKLRARAASDEWLPVASSPMGRRRTLDLARRGTIESAKVGRKVMVRAESLRAYIEEHRRVLDDPEDENLFGAETPVPVLRYRLASRR